MTTNLDNPFSEADDDDEVFVLVPESIFFVLEKKAQLYDNLVNAEVDPTIN